MPYLYSILCRFTLNVFQCDNDVADHQVVHLNYASGASVSFTMNAFTHDMKRETRICGSKAELRWDGSAENPLVSIFAFICPYVCKTLMIQQLEYLDVETRSFVFPEFLK